MRVGIYDPYLNTLGGGERFCLALASHWSKKHDVRVFWDDPRIRKEAEERLNLDLSGVKFVQNIFRGNNLIRKLFLTRQYDLIFFLSDGSIPITIAKTTVLLFQHPFVSVGGRSMWNQLKLRRVSSVVCYSRYTKAYLDREFGTDCIVIYPPVPVNEMIARTKENIILSVGRFGTSNTNKKQKEMVRFFRQLSSLHADWKLYLAGGVLPQDREYFDEVKREAHGTPITLLPNIPFSELKELYGKAAIYWHAAGYGVRQEENPSEMEHFGISTVEAMASGCIPIVYGGGGQLEIVRHGIDGIIWNKEQELIESTSYVITHPRLRMRMQESAMERAKEFNQFKFYAAFDRLIERII